MKEKIINILLLITFFITIMVPVTGIIVHKLASTLFLLLCLAHTFIYRKKMNAKKYIVLGMTVLAFVSGILGMIHEDIPWMLAAHKATSIILVFGLTIHIFVFHKRLPLTK